MNFSFSKSNCVKGD